MAPNLIVTRWDIEQAVVLTLQSHLQDYVDLVVSQHPSIEQPIPNVLRETIYGGADFQTWQPALNPGVIVEAEPVGDAVMFGSGDVVQWHELTIGVLAQGGDEDHARQIVDMYGAAVMAAIEQHGDLSEMSQNTVLIATPHVDFIDPDERRFMQSETVFHALISMTNAAAGSPDWGVAETINPQITVLHMTDTVPSSDVGAFPSAYVAYPEPRAGA
jgi:hypothetical protein